MNQIKRSDDFASRDRPAYRVPKNFRSCDRYSCLSTVATSLLADASNARDSLRIIPSVGDFSPLSSWPEHGLLEFFGHSGESFH